MLRCRVVRDRESAVIDEISGGRRCLQAEMAKRGNGSERDHNDGSVSGSLKKKD